VITDFAHREQISYRDADVCIVGAGAAGIALAAELAWQGKRVLLLESGGLEAEETLQGLNGMDRTGQSFKAPHAGRFRVLGGTTTRWGGQISELSAEDFAVREWVPGSGWPMVPSALKPYYVRALQTEGLVPVLQEDQEVWRQAGIHEPDMGEALAAYFTRWCPEPNFARLHRAALDDPNLHVVLHATVCSLLWDAETNSIQGVCCRNLQGREQIFTAQKYVLCLGMLETINLLLQPLDGGLRAPWQQNPWLGRSVQSHIDYNAARVLPLDWKKIERVFPNLYLDGRKYHPKLHATPEWQRRQQTLNIAGAISFITLGDVETDMRRLKSAARNLLRRNWREVDVRATLPALRRLPMLARLAYGFYVSHRAYWPRHANYWLRVHCEQEPLSASSITLSAERNALGMFCSRLDWRISPLEWRTIQRFAADAQHALEAAGLARLELQPELAEPDGYRNVSFDDSYHWMSGTRMATDARDGVVDTDLKLHGVRNAYVCSHSVFPTSGYANPVHTLLALALRLADHLTGKPYA
jgi:choline dehydrogenase-like flavoprotein